MKLLYSRVASAWCHLMHPAPMWPAHGHYRCPVCLREHPVPWEEVRTARGHRSEPVRARSAEMATAASR